MGKPSELRRLERRRLAREAAAKAAAQTAVQAEPAPAGVNASGSGSDTATSSTPNGIPHQPRNDAILERRALREGWSTIEAYKPAMVNRQVKIAIDPNTPNAESTRAFLAALRADRDQWERDNTSGVNPDAVKQVTIVEYFPLPALPAPTVVDAEPSPVTQSDTPTIPDVEYTEL